MGVALMNEHMYERLTMSVEIVATRPFRAFQ